MGKIHVVIQEPFPGSKVVGYYKNVYADIEGIVHPTPFNMPKEGMWFFDGQVFHQTPRHYTINVSTEAKP